MQRYVDEFAFRWNQKPASMATVFGQVVTRISQSTRLPYKELIA
jgi:hypothetical protein